MGLAIRYNGSEWAIISCRAFLGCEVTGLSAHHVSMKSSLGTPARSAEIAESWPDDLYCRFASKEENILLHYRCWL
ncbi:Uncharacterized protein HZ326_17415 [Fusarium oxysporum f. sp. albedinis]|nr:Uncharacterized protein HZ326_17415 [Fusarium oxysporum f. sp. albedinis]